MCQADDEARCDRGRSHARKVTGKLSCPLPAVAHEVIRDRRKVMRSGPGNTEGVRESRGARVRGRASCRRWPVTPERENNLVQLREIARTSRAVTGTSSRRAKRDLLAECLRRAEPSEVAIAVAYLSGELPQRQIGVGYAALREPPPPAGAAALSVPEVDAAFTAIGGLAGPGSLRGRQRLVGELLGRASAEEQPFLIRLLAGELRQGALDGVMADAIAAAAGVPAADVRRALMFRGSLGAVAEAALGESAARETGTQGQPAAEAGDERSAAAIAALRGFGLEVGRPIKPMLAQSAESPAPALARAGAGGPAAVEWKIDGIRVQAHIDGPAVRLFTRTLDDISARVPEVVAALGELP